MSSFYVAKAFTDNRVFSGKAFFLTVLLATLPVSAFSQSELSFTAEQAEAGKVIYKETCQICHGSSLSNGQFGTPLKGAFFRNNWKGKTLGELLQFTWEKMPPDKPMQYTRAQYAELTSYILSQNKLEAGETLLPEDAEAMRAVMLPW